MVRMGSLVAMGMVHVLLLLLCCLDFSGSVPVRAVTHDSLFVPSRFTWQDADFSLISVNKSIVFWFNEVEQKLKALQWEDSVIELPKGESFSGFLYFRDSSPGWAAFEFLPFRWLTTYDIMENYDDTDYCIAIDVEDTMLKEVPGHRSERLRPPCLQCNSWSCPVLMGPCECGYFVIRKDPTGKLNQMQRLFVGIRWFYVDKKKIDDDKRILP